MPRERHTLVAIQTVSRASVEVAPNWKTEFRIHPALAEQPLQELLGAATKKKEATTAVLRPTRTRGGVDTTNKQTNRRQQQQQQQHQFLNPLS
jgi:hypothetical protein